MNTTISGGSDDLIELNGEFCEEIDYLDFDDEVVIEASDGTVAAMLYDGDWLIEVQNEGSLFLEKIEHNTNGCPHSGNGEDCEDYSDVLVFKPGLEWIDVGGKRYRPLKK